MTIKDTKHWSTKSEAAKDEVKDALEEAIDWLIVRRREAGWVLGGAAALIAAAGLFLYQRNARANESWDRLSLAELNAYSGRPQEAADLLKKVQETGSPAAAALAHLLEGDLSYPRGEYDKALASYDKALAEAPEALRPYALAEKAMVLEAAGKPADCAAAAQSFIDVHSDHLLAPQIAAVLARCQAAQGQAEAAKTTLQRITLQYQSSPWAGWATARLKAPVK